MYRSDMAKGKFYITTAIDYVNAKPHIGHAVEKLQADVVARYRRIKGDDVWFLTGTDEHGAKIVRAAETAEKDVKSFVDENAGYFKRLKQTLNLSWDDFIRTSDRKNHWPGAQKLWLKLRAAGDLYLGTYRGMYCVGHEAFITEKDLIDGKCRDHKKAPESVEEQNWMFRLSRYSKEIKKQVESGKLRIVPETRKHEILAMLEEGLEDVSFSRPRKDLSWGIPVPNDETQTMYVWCDALSNYITAIGYIREGIEFKKWWPADVHVIGKDILRFHAALWPGMLLSAGLPLPKLIFVHGFITVEGEKMSKTVGNIVDPEELVRKYGTDPVRYYLLREIPAHEDGDFSEKKFIERHNGDLANGLGNLVARVAAIGEKLSPIGFDFKKNVNKEVKKNAGDIFKNYEKYLEEFRLNEALAEIWKLISFADKYLNENKPWDVSDQAALKIIMANAGYLIGEIANLLKPFLPETADKISFQFSVGDSEIKIKKDGALFPRI